MLKKIFAKFKKLQNTETSREQLTPVAEMKSLLDELKNIFAAELLIDPRIRDFETTAYGNSCRQRCNNIMEKTTQLTEKIKNHIEQNKELHDQKESYTAFVSKILSNLKESSGKLNSILNQQNTESKERQLKCYNLGMTVQQSTRTLIDTYIATFNKNR